MLLISFFLTILIVEVELRRGQNMGITYKELESDEQA